MPISASQKHRRKQNAKSIPDFASLLRPESTMSTQASSDPESRTRNYRQYEYDGLNEPIHLDQNESEILQTPYQRSLYHHVDSTTHNNLDPDDISFCTPYSHVSNSLSRVPHIPQNAVDTRSKQVVVDIDKSCSPEFTSPKLYQRKSSKHYHNLKKETGLHQRPSKLSIGSHSSDSSHSRSTPSDICSSEEALDMKYTDITHDQLKNSLARISGERNQIAGYNPAIYHEKTALRNHINDNGLSININNYDPPSSQESHLLRFDSVLKAKDNMLQEKESVILKLRLQLANMQHQYKEDRAMFLQVGSIL